MRVLVTGAGGFIGRHLTAALNALEGTELYAVERDTPREKLEEWCAVCDFAYHLAGADRPQAQEEYMSVNYGFTETLLKTLVRAHNACPVMFASSVQAAASSLYGKSKKAGEELVMQYGRETGAATYIYRLPVVFGKWDRPGRGSPVATLCHDAANGRPPADGDPNAVMQLVYIDDLIEALARLPEGECRRDGDYCAVPGICITDARKLAETVGSFYTLRPDGNVPDLGDPLTRGLYATYQSYLPQAALTYPLDMHEDGYGSMSRFIRTPDRGQISVNVMRPGISEGAHWHNVRAERHLIVSGTGVVRLRPAGGGEYVEYPVSGERHAVVEIPAGCMHAVCNTGGTDLIDVVWSSVCWDPQKPDTFA